MKENKDKTTRSQRNIPSRQQQQAREKETRAPLSCFAWLPPPERFDQWFVMVDELGSSFLPSSLIFFCFLVLGPKCGANVCAMRVVCRTAARIFQIPAVLTRSRTRKRLPAYAARSSASEGGKGREEKKPGKTCLTAGSFDGEMQPTIRHPCFLLQKIGQPTLKWGSLRGFRFCSIIFCLVLAFLVSSLRLCGVSPAYHRGRGRDLGWLFAISTSPVFIRSTHSGLFFWSFHMGAS